jgi:hypothetical protein
MLGRLFYTKFHENLLVVMETEYAEKWPMDEWTCDDFVHLVQTIHIKGVLISRPASKNKGV